MAYLINDQTGEAVEIPEGESTVGRGPLLKITDKRVSRNHALLQLEKGKFKLCPKHKNPCFYKAVGETSFTILSKDVWQELHHGDLFKLLPDTLIFRVVEKSSGSSKSLSKGYSTVVEEQAPKSSVDTKPTKQKKSDTTDFLDELFCDPNAITRTEPTPSSSSSRKANAKETLKQASDSKASSTVAEPSAPTIDSAGTQPAADVKDEDTVKSKVKKEESQSTSSEKAGSTNKPRRLPDWLAGVTSHVAATASSTSSGKAPASRKRKTPSSSNTSSTAKRAKAASPADEDRDDGTLPSSPPPKKKASTKDTVDDTTTSSTESKPSAKKEPVKTTSKTAAAASAKVTASKEKEKDKKKPLCPYGTKCYRKNPVHFKEYSHDFSSPDANSDGGDDSDSDDSDKPVCPYGADCYRKNPAHRKEYKHPGPPVTRSKRATGSRRSTRKITGRSIVAGDSDDDGEPNTYDYNDSFIDDEESEGSSSYGGESEDSDWAPPPVAPPTGAAADDDDDDIDELLSEAKHFIANKKMRKQ